MGEDLATAQAWLTSNNVKYSDCYEDGGSWFAPYTNLSGGGGGIPENFVIDRDGNIRWFGVGYLAGDSLYDPTGAGGAIDELLGQNFP